MREIKFRIWDGETKEYVKDGWTYGFHIYANRNIQGPDPLGEIFEQFTGLHDKNGKEIYEGDIVRWDINQFHPIGIVDYIDSYGGYDLKNIYDDYHVCNDWGRGEYEVVGNIHENPELLK